MGNAAQAMPLAPRVGRPARSSHFTQAQVEVDVHLVREVRGLQFGVALLAQVQRSLKDPPTLRMTLPATMSAAANELLGEELSLRVKARLIRDNGARIRLVLAGSEEAMYLHKVRPLDAASRWCRWAGTLLDKVAPIAVSGAAPAFKPSKKF